MAEKNRRKKGEEGKLAGIIIIIIIMLLIGLVLYTFVSVKSENVPRDKETLCRLDGQHSKHIVLLDITGAYNLTQHKSIRNKIEEIVKALKIDEQLELYFITSDIKNVLKPLMSVCNPGTGENVDSFFGNPKLIKKRWEAKLYKPLNKILTKFDEKSMQSESSPILETIQIINNSSIKKSKKETKQTLSIISDFIQHSSDYSFLRNRISRFWQSDYKHKIHTNLNKADVNLIFMRRNGRTKFMSGKYLEFWETYLDKMKSGKVVISKLEG